LLTGGAAAKADGATAAVAQHPFSASEGGGGVDRGGVGRGGGDTRLRRARCSGTSARYRPFVVLANHGHRSLHISELQLSSGGRAVAGAKATQRPKPLG